MFCINSLILFLLVPPPSTDTKKWWDDGTGKIDFEVHCGSNGENIEFLFLFQNYQKQINPEQQIKILLLKMMALFVSNAVPYMIMFSRAFFDIILFFIVSGGTILKFPSSIQSDGEWTPLSPISVHQSPSMVNGTAPAATQQQQYRKSSPPPPPPSSSTTTTTTNGNNTNVSSVIGFWNNRQSN